MIDFTGIEVGLFEPGFGALMARRAVQTLVAALRRRRRRLSPRRGAPAQRQRRPARLAAPVRAAAASPPTASCSRSGRGCQSSSPTCSASRIFADPAGNLLLRAARRRPPLPARRMPGWADFNGGDMYYGFPDLEGRGVKFAHDTHGAAGRSRHPVARADSDAALAEVIAFRDRRFPLLSGAPLTESRVCQYENSSNGDFLIDRHPAMPMSCWSAADRATASSTAPKSAASPPRWCQAAAPSRAALQPRHQGRNPEARSALSPSPRRARECRPSAKRRCWRVSGANACPRSRSVEHVARLRIADASRRWSPGLATRSSAGRSSRSLIIYRPDRRDRAASASSRVAFAPASPGGGRSASIARCRAGEDRVELAQRRFDPVDEALRPSRRRAPLRAHGSARGRDGRARQHVAGEAGRGIGRRLRLLGLEPAADILRLGGGVERLGVGFLELALELGDAVVLGQLGRVRGGFRADLFGFVVQVFLDRSSAYISSGLAP